VLAKLWRKLHMQHSWGSRLRTASAEPLCPQPVSGHTHSWMPPAFSHFLQQGDFDGDLKRGCPCGSSPSQLSVQAMPVLPRGALLLDRRFSTSYAVGGN